ncbi:DUF262 domain-containing protein [Mycoplasma crocodyli]|uniref:DUF262 domain-containing protein n=1 Tax=Mycoplasma crocodyli TaxID=50052 RepID=UPI0002F0C001|nr:DUF262 domain-containing protein [Mycoplasma crocodyli]
MKEKNNLQEILSQYWTLGTNTSLYLEKIKNWFSNIEFFKEFPHVYLKVEDLGNGYDKVGFFKKGSNKRLDTTPLYKGSDVSEYARATFQNQFLRYLIYCNIFQKNNGESNYYFNKKFENVKDEYDYNEKIVEYISHNINNKLNELLKCLRDDVSFKDEDFSKSPTFSIWYDTLRSIIDSGYSELTKHIYELNNKTEIKKNKNLYWTNNKLKLDNKIVLEIAKVLSESLNLENNNFRDIILTNKKLKTIDNFNDPWVNKPNYKEGNSDKDESKIMNFFEFLSLYKNFSIPIFQRSYIWKKEYIENFLESLYDDINDGTEYSYLNNIIISQDGTCWDIIDGQQRIFTMIMVLYFIYKYKVNKGEEVSLMFIELFEYKNHKTNRYELNHYNNSIEIEVYNDFNLLLNVGNDKSKYDELTNTNLLKHIQTIGNFLLKEVEKVDVIFERILTKTNFTITILCGKKKDKIFSNLNMVQAQLEAIDLFKNKVYSSASLIYSSKDSRNRIMKKLNDEVLNNFKNEKGELYDNKKFILFIDILANKLQIETSSNCKTSKPIDVAKLSFQILDYYLQENNDNIDQVIDKLKDDSIVFSYIYGSKNIVGLSSKMIKNYMIRSQILTTSTKTVFLPIIWELIDSCNFIKSELSIESIYDLSRWLFEIERFWIFWTISGFSGESIGEKCKEIANNIRTSRFSTYNIENFRYELINMIPSLRRDFKKNNETFKEDSQILLFDNVKSKTINAPNTKTILIRLNTFFHNKMKGYINKDTNRQILENNYFDPFEKNELEHYLARKPVKNEEITNIEEYNEHVSKIGNLFILNKFDNIKKSNKNIKQPVYENRYQYLYHGYKNENQEFLMDWHNSNFEEKTLKDKYKQIIQRSEQLLTLMHKLYFYTDEEVEDLIKKSKKIN